MNARRAESEAPGPVFELDALDAIVLASVALAFVPGARGVAAWPAIWLAPGWFVARRVLGVRGFALVPLALGSSIAVGALVLLPSVLASSRPSGPAALASIAVFALTCAHRRVRFPLALPVVRPPAVAYTASLGAYFVLRVVMAWRSPQPDLSNPDGPYFVGMVKSLATSFPPACYEAAGRRLAQPWGYWLLYAASHVTSGATIAQTLGVASAVVAIAFLTTLYLAAALFARGQLAGALTLPLALAGSAAPWFATAAGVVAGDRDRWGGLTASARNVWDGFYDLPALTLLALALLVASLALRDRSGRLAAVAFALGVVLPFHHPAYFLVGALALGAALLFEIGRGRARAGALVLVVLAPLPFYVLFVRLYARDLPSQPAFFADVITLGYWLDSSRERLVVVLAEVGIWLPFAVAGGLRASGLPRSAFVALFATSLALAVLTDDAAHNLHWPLDPLSVAAIVFAAVACARGIERRRGVGLAVCGALIGLGIVGSAARWSVRTQPPPSDERDLAAWALAATREDATFVVRGDDAASVAAIEGLAERRLFYGFRFHLALTTPAPVLAHLEETNAAILRDPTSERLASSGVDYVVESPPRGTPGADAWREGREPFYENASFAVYGVSR